MSRLSSGQHYSPTQATGKPNTIDHPAAVDHPASADDPISVARVLAKLQRLAGEKNTLGEFLPEFLQEVTAVLQGVAAAVWEVEAGQMLKLTVQQDLQQTGLLTDQERLHHHGGLLSQAVQSGQPLALQPTPEQLPKHASESPWQRLSEHQSARLSANSSNFLVLVIPVAVDGKVEAVIELFLPAEVPRDRWQSVLRLASQICQPVQLAWQKAAAGRQARRDLLAEGLHQFARRVHASLQPKIVAFTVAHEGRRLIACDRVSVVLSQGSSWWGHRCRVRAVSGAETVESRSASIKALQRLVGRVIGTGEDFWFDENCSAEDWPPQLSVPLQHYLDESFAKAVAIELLWQPPAIDVVACPPEQELQEIALGKPRGPILGALVLEMFGEASFPATVRPRGDVLRTHAEVALANAISVDQLFLMPLGRALGQLMRGIGGRALPKSLTLLGMVVALVISLCILPAPFWLHGRGTLQPTVRRQVFAHTTGVVDQVAVRHGQQVTQQEPLLQLRDDQIRRELIAVTGQWHEAQERQNSINGRLVQPGLPLEERTRLAGELETLQASFPSLDRRRQLLEEQVQQLKILSPLSGQITTWDLNHLLTGKPVERGQVLLEVADLSQDWEIQVNMPERRMGHIARAQRRCAAGGALQVSFVLATDPEVTYTGLVQEIGSRADVDQAEGDNVVLLRVQFDRDQLPAELLRPGAGVTVKVDCGHRPVGYVWLHDLIDWLNREVLFRL